MPSTTVASPPDRSLIQRRCALQVANEVRTKRAHLKRDLKGGRCSIHTLLMDPPAYVETAKVFDMLRALPKVGRMKANQILTQARVSPSKSVGGLSGRQRAALDSLTSGRGPLGTGPVLDLLRTFEDGATHGQLAARFPGASLTYELQRLRVGGLAWYDRLEGVWHARPQGGAL